MKAAIDRESLVKAFALASGAIPTNSPKPILHNVKLDVGEDQATMIATNLDIGIRQYVSVVECQDPGSVILPARVAQIARLSKDKEILIECEEGASTVTISGLRTSYDLPTEDPALFPDVPEFGADSYYEVRDIAFKDAVRRTVFAIDEASTRYALGGTLWEFGIDHMVIVGCDGRRLARQLIACETIGTPDVGQVVVPGKTLKLLDKLIGKDEMPIHIAATRFGIAVRTDAATITSRLVEGRFPRYQDVFPSRINHRLEMPASDLLLGVSQASILTSEESRGVDFHFQANQLVLSSKSSDRGKSKIIVPMPGSNGLPFLIRFDPAYMLPMLHAIPEESPITINVEDNRSGILMSVDCGYDYIIMPLTVEQEAEKVA